MHWNLLILEDLYLWGAKKTQTNMSGRRRKRKIPSSSWMLSEKGGDPATGSPTATLLRLHPSHGAYLGKRSPLRVKLPASGILHFHGVTGGVYKTRERIHRGMLIRDY